MELASSNNATADIPKWVVLATALTIVGGVTLIIYNLVVLVTGPVFESGLAKTLIGVLGLVWFGVSGWLGTLVERHSAQHHAPEGEEEQRSPRHMRPRTTWRERMTSRRSRAGATPGSRRRLNS